MAEAPDPVSKTVLELEQEVTCSICHEHFQEPKLLPCCHYYCKQCLVDLTKQYKSNQPFPCPDCREPTLLPGNDPDGLPTAFFINRMKELHSRMEKAHGKLEAPCEMCSGGKTVAFCRQCAHFICEECVKSHERMKVFTGHVICTLDELKQGGAKELSLKDTPTQKCEVHEEPKKIFCFDCNQLICRDCIVFDHAGHKSEFVKKAAPNTRIKLAKHLSPLKKLIPPLDAAVEQVKGTKEAIEAEKHSTAKRVNTAFQELHEILVQCKNRLLEELSSIAQKKVENLSAQEKNLDLSLGTVHSLVEFVERTLENASDEEVITMQDQILDRIDGEVAKRGKDTTNVEPVEAVDVGIEVSIAEGLRELCKKKARVFQREIIDPMKCTVEGDGLRNAEVGKACKIVVVANGSSGRRAIQAVDVQAALKSLVDKSTIKANGICTRPGTYSIEYTPKVRGRHYLVVTVDDQPITGSPFSVFVTIPPTKLDKPVRVINGIHSPRYLAFNSSEELIVTEYSGDIVIFNKDGKKLRSISKSKHGFSDIAGVAVDEGDNIYVSDCRHKRVHKFSKEGELLKQFGKKGNGPEELDFPRGIAVIDDQVLVCNTHNNRVQVLTTELEHVKQIGSKGYADGQFTRPEDVATDNEYVYVTDPGNNRIQVFTKKGQFVRSFGNKENGVLDNPTGVCVDHVGNVFVVEYGNGCVTVFSKAGQFVTSFGEGCTYGTYGITIDKDGFVYVCNGATSVSVF